jgi:phage terminase small subunit
VPKCPEPLEWLHEYAKQEWWRTAPQLHVLGLLSSVDVACLAAYCSGYAMWRHSSEELDFHDTGLRSAPESVDQNYPRRRSRHSAQRGRVWIDSGRQDENCTRHPQQPPNKFDGLLAGPQE